MKRYSEIELGEIRDSADSFFQEMEGKTILIAGATGFIGSWLTAALDFAKREKRSNIKVFGMARTFSPEFRRAFPTVQFLECDISDLSSMPPLYPDCVFNAATPSVPARGGKDPQQILNASIQGTENLLDLCGDGSNPLFINLSSGIVTKRKNDKKLDLTRHTDAYLHGKRISERLVDDATKIGKVQSRNFRLYAFAGPGISLIDHFAVGNFLFDALSGKPIVISGNPSTVRSYLYPTDLISNLLNLSIGNFNDYIELGSKFKVTMQELADLINLVTGNVGIEQAQMFGASNDYTPEQDFDVIRQAVDLKESISRWVKWLKYS